MEHFNFLIIILIFSCDFLNCLVINSSDDKPQKNIICYWQAILPASEINPHICTHIIYSFIGVNASGDLNYLYADKAQVERRLAALTSLKNRNKNLKFLAAVGGADSEQTKSFSTVSKSLSTRSRFIGNLISFCKKYALHGIDIDYEYPSGNVDKINFAQLLDEARQMFDLNGFILSIAVAPDRWRAEEFYDIPRISKSSHIINLMAYDFHGRWSDRIGHHAQMYPHHQESDYTRELNCAASVAYWISKGAEPHKLHFGIPTYGNVFRLTNVTRHKVGEMSVDRNLTLSLGVPIGFDEFCRIKKLEWRQYFDTNSRVYYAVNEAKSMWLGFDHPNQVAMKAKFINHWNLGGVMFWSLDTDDRENFCNFGSFPLISKANEIFRNFTL